MYVGKNMGAGVLAIVRVSVGVYLLCIGESRVFTGVLERSEWAGLLN
jgi:hypothetical protein